MASPIPTQPKKLDFSTPKPTFKTRDGETFYFEHFLKDQKRLHLVGAYPLFVGPKGVPAIFDLAENDKLTDLYQQEMSKLDETPPKKKKRLRSHIQDTDPMEIFQHQNADEIDNGEMEDEDCNDEDSDDDDPDDDEDHDDRNDVDQNDEDLDDDSNNDNQNLNDDEDQKGFFFHTLLNRLFVMKFYLLWT